MNSRNTTKNALYELYYLVDKVAEENGLTTKNIAPIYDGVADIDSYLETSPKVLWLMKEPYDEVDDSGCPCGGGWNLPVDCFKKDDAWKNPTWQPIIYAMYGVQNCLRWHEMNYIRDDKSMADVLQTIAYVNLNKMPNKSVSSDDEITAAYGIWRLVILRQIEVLNPDVIVCGGTFSYIRNDLGLGTVTPVKTFANGNIKVYRASGRKIVEAYHPNQRTILRGDYVNGVIDTIDL